MDKMSFRLMIFAVTLLMVFSLGYDMGRFTAARYYAVMFLRGVKDAADSVLPIVDDGKRDAGKE